MLTAGIIGCGQEQGTQTDQTTQITSEQTDDKLLQKWCADCHAPPQPGNHSPSEWPNVVMRMQNHRTMKGMTSIPEPEIDDIISYLQSHDR